MVNCIEFRMKFYDLCQINGRRNYYFMDTFECKTNFNTHKSVVKTYFSLN